MTRDFSSWNPTNTSWAEQEDSLLDSDGNIPFPLVRESHNLISEDETEMCSCEVVEQTIDDFFFPPVVGILRDLMMMAKNNGSLLKMQ